MRGWWSDWLRAARRLRAGRRVFVVMGDEVRVL